MRKSIIRACLFGALTIPSVVSAQSMSAPSDAERAAAAAERAAAAAEAAAEAANEAAEAARQAARGTVQQDLPVEQNLTVQASENTWDLANAASRTERQARFTESVEESVANGPGYRNHKTTGYPEFQLVASDDKTVASISLSMDVSGVASENANNLNSTLLTLTASTALAKSGSTSFGDLSGLTDGTDIKLSLTHYESRFEPQDIDLEPVATAEAACRRKEAKNPDVAKLCDAEGHDNGVAAFVAKHNPRQVRSFVDSVLPGPVMFYGIEGKIGQANFEYLDQPSFTMKEASRFSYSGTVFGGAIFNGGNTSLGASFEFGRQRKAQDPITLCQAINAIPQTQCITAAAGAPTLKRKSILAVELRHAFGADIGEFAKFAIAPQVSYNLESDAYGVDVPVYLVGDGKGKLRGGFRAGYTNEKKAGGGRDGDFSLGVFVGVPFSVFR